MKKFLFAWIGTADIEASVHQKTGPIAQALSGNHVDEVVLLTNYPAEKRQNYLNWLETKYSGNISVKYDDFSDPTDYNSVYNHCNRVLGDIKKKQDGECKYIFHLSPGTPTMHAIWVLLGKTIFPADLIQTSEEKRGVEHINIPFDIAAEYVPPLLFNKTDDEIIHLQQSLSPDDPNFNDIVWRSEQMRDVIIMAHRIAVRDLPVLIEGESGTGKELFAQAIHQASNRADKPFVPGLFSSKIA